MLLHRFDAASKWYTHSIDHMKPLSLLGTRWSTSALRDLAEVRSENSPTRQGHG
jgi:hypothetical protein